MIEMQAKTAEEYRMILNTLDFWRPKIEAALESGDGTHTFDDLVGIVMRGDASLFAYPGALLVMELAVYPQFKVWHCFLACGEMSAVRAAEPNMMKVAEMLGCKYISIAGRAGWERVLKPAGWHTVCVTMYKEVGYGVEQNVEADADGRTAA